MSCGLAEPNTELDDPVTFRSPTVFEVDETTDEVKDPMSDPCECKSFPSNKCTLRAAVMSANQCGDAVIQIEFVVSGNHKLDIGTGTDDDAASGDLDIHKAVTIFSAPLVSTTIEAAAIDDRIFDIHPTAAYAHLSGFKAIKGHLDPSLHPLGDSHGGCIRARSPSFTMNSVILGGDTGEGCVGHSGGGLHIRDSVATITNSIIADNHATPWIVGGAVVDGVGGGLSAWNTELHVDDTYILNNIASGSGGGIAHDAESEGFLAELIEVTIEGNSTFSAGGGGLMLAAFQMSNSVVSNNLVIDTSSSGGGGLFVGPLASGASFVETTEIFENSAPAGGGIVLQGQLDVRETDLHHNDAYASGGPGGGISTREGSSLVLESSSLHFNTAGNGGGIHIRGEAPIVNTTLVHNVVDGDGGAVYVDENATTNLLHCTLRRNNAAGSGGGVFAEPLSATSIDRTILFGNPSSSPTPECTGPVTAAAEVVSSPGSCLNPPGLVIAGNALGWGALSYGGHPTLSLAIVPPNVAGSATVPCGVAVDQWGTPRVGEVCDIGAYENITF